jgi:hypothetical protein
MYVLKGKPKNSTPHSSQTDDPRTTKIGRYNFGPDLTPCAKIGLSQLMGGGATKPQFYINLRGFRLFFSSSNQTSTRKSSPITMFDTSNNVFPCIFVCEYIDIFPNSNLGGHLPQNPHFFRNRDFSRPTHQNGRIDRTD